MFQRLMLRRPVCPPAPPFCPRRRPAAGSNQRRLFVRAWLGVVKVMKGPREQAACKAVRKGSVGEGKGSARQGGAWWAKRTMSTREETTMPSRPKPVRPKTKSFGHGNVLPAAQAYATCRCRKRRACRGSVQT